MDWKKVPSNLVMYIIPKQNEVDIERQVISFWKKYISFSKVIATINGRNEARYATIPDNEAIVAVLKNALIM